MATTLIADAFVPASVTTVIFLHLRCAVTFLVFLKDPPPTEFYTLSLHDALPISCATGSPPPRPGRTTCRRPPRSPDRKSTRLNSSHVAISYAVFCLKKKKKKGKIIKRDIESTKRQRTQKTTQLSIKKHVKERYRT